jgi:hypothetical protein
MVKACGVVGLLAGKYLCLAMQKFVSRSPIYGNKSEIWRTRKWQRHWL